MSQYRKKPVIIEAILCTPHNRHKILDFTEGKAKYFNVEKDGWEIDTLEGVMTANMGDWIIKGIKGEFYTCKPDIFEATYELVE